MMGDRTQLLNFRVTLTRDHFRKAVVWFPQVKKEPHASAIQKPKS